MRDLGGSVGVGDFLLPLWRLVAFGGWQYLTVCLGGRLCLRRRLLFCAHYLLSDRHSHLLTTQHGHYHSRLHFLRAHFAAVATRGKGSLQLLFDDR